MKLKSLIIALSTLFLVNCVTKTQNTETTQSEDIAYDEEYNDFEEKIEEEETNPQSVQYIYGIYGEIDSISATIVLNRYNSSDQVDGTLHRKGLPEQELQGILSLQNGTLTLDEVKYNTETEDYDKFGNISGTVDNKLNIQGVWTSKNRDKSKQLSFKSKLIDTHHNLNFEFMASSADIDSYDSYNAQIYNYYCRLSEVNIKDENKDNETIQTLNLADLAVYAYKSDRNGNIEIADYNFDGYMDIAIGYSIPGAWKNDFGYIYYLYDANLKKFVQNKELSDLQVLSIDYDNKYMIKWLADGSLNESEMYYSYIDKKYYLVKADYRTSEGKYSHYEYEIKNGESIEIVKEEGEVDID